MNLKGKHRDIKLMQNAQIMITILPKLRYLEIVKIRFVKYLD